jgi:tRNA threonylcarbamoyladenosine biosynthesis protein TsaB
MRILGIETATLVCGAALVAEKKVLADVWVEEKNIHSERLMAQVSTALEEAHLTVDEIDGIALSVGPGSFTGLRIGASVAKGLAFATAKPIAAVPTLSSLAERIIRSGGNNEGKLLFPVLDARRDEVYCQLFEVRGSKAVPLNNPQDMTVEHAVMLVGDRMAIVTGEAAGKLLSHPAPGGMQRLLAADPQIARCSGGIIALMGEEMLERGETVDAGELEPEYIKEFYFRQRQQR